MSAEHPTPLSEGGIPFGFAVPIEQEVRSDGKTQILYGAITNGEAGLEAVRQAIEDDTGGEVTVVEEGKTGTFVPPIVRRPGTWEPSGTGKKPGDFANPQNELNKQMPPGSSNPSMN